MPLNNVFCGWNKKILQVLYYFTGACYIAFCCVMMYSHHWLGIIKSWGSLGLFNRWKNISRAVIKHYLSRSGWLQTYNSINPILGLLSKKTAISSFYLQTPFFGGGGGIFHPGESICFELVNCESGAFDCSCGQISLHTILLCDK